MPVVSHFAHLHQEINKVCTSDSNIYHVPFVRIWK